MKRENLIIMVAVIVFFSIAAGVIAFATTSGKYKKELAKSEKSQQEVQEKIDKIKADKDKDNYLPSDAVRFFVNEVKSANFDKAKLYLAKDAQNLDIQNGLGFDYPLNEVMTKEVTYEDNDGVTNVKYSYGSDSESINSVKYFEMVKEDSVWKISKIKGEL